MHFKSSLPVLSTFVLLIVTQACRAQLMCYTCDDCPQITAQTPVQECNEDFFNTGGTELPSTMTTTTTMPTTTDDPTTQSTEDEEITIMTTEEVVDTTTTMATTEAGSTESPASTEKPMPTPATVGPPVTTTGMPTPPNPGTVIVPSDVVISAENEENMMRPSNTTHLFMSNATVSEAITSTTTAVPTTTRAYTPSSEMRLRQRRDVINNGTTYHCYRVQKKSVNDTLIIDRGCSRVTAAEGVCNQLTLMNNNTALNKCLACSTKLCNGSSTLAVSTLAVIIGAVTALLFRN